MALSIDGFCERLTASKLLAAEEARSVLSSVAEYERPTDGESLAALLVKSGRLTAFQAKQICEGMVAEGLQIGSTSNRAIAWSAASGMIEHIDGVVVSQKLRLCQA